MLNVQVHATDMHTQHMHINDISFNIITLIYTYYTHITCYRHIPALFLRQILASFKSGTS